MMFLLCCGFHLAHYLHCLKSFIMAEFNESEAPKSFDWIPEGCVPLAGK